VNELHSSWNAAFKQLVVKWKQLLTHACIITPFQRTTVTSVSEEQKHSALISVRVTGQAEAETYKWIKIT
jgi:hypothetical protein